jgi:SNF2 family DNA or RNA helicase
MVKPQPILVKGFKLLPHQEDAIEWMKHVEIEVNTGQDYYGLRGGILGLEKGLGKTITSLVLSVSSPGSYPTLILCKKMFLGDTWKKEIETRFSKSRPIRVLYLHRDFIPQEEITSLTRASLKANYDLVVTTYEFCMKVNREHQFWREGSMFGVGTKPKLISIGLRTTQQALKGRGKGSRVIYDTPWRRVICDESQNFSNGTSKIFKAVMALVADYRWCLSGGIIKNYDTDIHSQLRFLGYSSVTKPAEWKSYGLTFFKTQNLSKRILEIGYASAGVKMPSREEYFLEVGLAGNFLKVYQLVLGSLKSLFERGLKMCVLALLTRIRQTLVSPYLMTSSSKRAPADSPVSGLLEEIIPKNLWNWCLNKKRAGWGAPKIAKSFELIDHILSLTGYPKVIIFSTQVTALDLMAERLTEEYSEKTRFSRLDGSMTSNQRTSSLDDFRTSRDNQILLASYKVCAESLTITEASFCILLDFWWNNATRDQAIARLWRLGQTQKVTVFSIKASGTLDTRIEEVCRMKNILASEYLKGGSEGKGGPKVKLEIVKELLS